MQLTDVDGEMDESKSKKKKHGWVVALAVSFMALVFGGLGTAVGGFYLNVVLPEDNYAQLTQDVTWKKLNVDRMEFRQAKDFEVSEKRLRKLSAEFSHSNPVPDYLLARLYHNEDRLPQAIRYYEKALKLIDSSWYNQSAYRLHKLDAQGGLAISYYENNNHEQALTVLKAMGDRIQDHVDAEYLEAIRNSLEDPERGSFHLALGNILKSRLRLPQARAEFERARQLSSDPYVQMEADRVLKTEFPHHLAELPPLVRYYSLAGKSHEQERSYFKAAQFYEQVAQEAPEFEWAHNALAIAYRKMKDNDKAVMAARKAITVNPDYYQPYLTLGDIALDQEQYPEAVLHFEKAQHLLGSAGDWQTLGTGANIQNQIGFAYELMKNLPQAERHYRLALQKSSEAMDLFEKDGRESETAEAIESDLQDEYDYAESALARLNGHDDRQIMHCSGKKKKKPQ